VAVCSALGVNRALSLLSTFSQAHIKEAKLFGTPAKAGVRNGGIVVVLLLLLLPGKY
jgi:hypothetical protein